MNIRKSFIYTFFLSLIGISHSWANTTIAYSDTVPNTKSPKNVDSVIEHHSKKYKITSWMYDELYRDPSPDIIQTSNSTIVVEKKDPLKKYEGKIIRNVIIKVLDPFGTDINDTLLLVPGDLSTWANRVSIESRDQNIRSQLLFKPGQELDPLTLRESERLLRKQEYVRDARVIIPSTTKKNADTVDVIVIVQDRWSISVGAGLSTTSGDYRITETNLLGTGTKITQRGIYDFTNFKFTDWSGELKDVNIKNTYIDATVAYRISPNSRSYGINFDRTFYSPLTKWAGSAGYSRINNDLEYTQTDGAFVPAKLVYNNYDFWLGRSLPISNLNFSGRRTSLVVATRYIKTVFVEKPDLKLDTLDSFKNQDFVLFSIGLSSRRYYKDTKIFRFGNTEDVPEGRTFNFIGGYYNEGRVNFLYTAMRFSAGERIDNVGYFFGSAEYGIYYNDYVPSRGTLNIDFTYFTDLISFGKWGARQFITASITNGLNRLTNENITINGRGPDGLLGINSSVAFGEDKYMLKFQSVFYTPFNFAGIQLATFAFAGFGKIGKPFYPEIDPNKIYQAYVVGLQARKENLAINTIQISFGFYPNIPAGTGDNIRYNPISLGRGSFNDFDVSKPELIEYR